MPMLALLLAGALLDRARPAFEAMKGEHVSATVRFLSDDLLEGRGTGTHGHAVAERYVASQMQALGLRPAGEDGYFQRVKLCESKARGSLSVNGAAIPDVVVAGDCGAKLRDLEGELAFVSYAESGEIP
jgi:hypothetical protein